MNTPGLVLTVVMSPDGKISVNGPLQNKLVCYGLLECARQIIQAYEQPSPILVPVPAEVAAGMPNLRDLNRGLNGKG